MNDPDPDRPSPAEHVRRQVMRHGPIAERAVADIVEHLRLARESAELLGLDLGVFLVVKGR